MPIIIKYLQFSSNSIYIQGNDWRQVCEPTTNTEMLVQRKLCLDCKILFFLIQNSIKSTYGLKRYAKFYLHFYVYSTLILEMSQTLLWVYITGENWWSSTLCNWLMRGEIKQHLLDSVSMESKKMHKKKKKPKCKISYMNTKQD